MKSKSKNLPYAKVRLRVFPSLSAAESYCKAHDISTDEIQYGESEDLKKEVMQIAVTQKAILREVREALTEQTKRVHSEFMNAVKVRDDAEKTRDLSKEYYADRVTELAGKIQSLGEARSIVCKYLEELEWMTGWKG